MTPKASGKAGPARPRWLLVVVLAVLAAVGVAYSGGQYLRYHDSWLRKPPRVPTCVAKSRIALREGAAVSGTEPHDDAEGKTVYLTEAQDLAVRCVKMASPEVAANLVSAFAETETELRALELLKVLRDKVPKDIGHDRDAALAFMVVQAALVGLPKLPETTAALEELELLHACRFSTRTVCPTRPGIPFLVWIPGAPSALALVGLLGMGIYAGLRRVPWRRIEWVRRLWRKRRKARAKSA